MNFILANLPAEIKIAHVKIEIKTIDIIGV